MTERKNSEPKFAIQRIYTQDVSFESPNTPDIFRIEWKPKVKLDLNTQARSLNEGVYEVLLKVTVEATIEEKTAFLVEVKQAGVFTIKDFPEENRNQMLAAYCPGLLFPYAREAIDALVVKGSFPALMLAPVNFDALYAQSNEKKQSNLTN